MALSTQERVKRYQATRDAIMIRPSKADGERIRSAAAAAGLSVQQFILSAVFQKIGERTEREQ